MNLSSYVLESLKWFDVKGILAILLSGVLLVGCGQTGALYLPQQAKVQQVKEPIEDTKVNEGVAVVTDDDTQDY